MARPKSTASPKDSSANLGFEAKLWLTADKLRNNMDAAEYKHVVLGLTFRRDLHPDLRADYVLANPPFNAADTAMRDSAILTREASPQVVSDAETATLLHELMTAKTRVHEMELSV